MNASSAAILTLSGTTNNSHSAGHPNGGIQAILAFVMSGLVYLLALWLLVAVGAWNVGTSSSSAAEPLETFGNIRWIVYASRQNAVEAIGLARRFGSDFGQPTVISTTNGWYAVAAGPISVPDWWP